MNKSSIHTISRRGFISSASGLMLGSCFPGLLPSKLLAAARVQETIEELTPEELKWVEQSIMAEDLKNYFHKGYNCAESLLLASVRYLKKPAELVWFACGYGGGLLHRDLCGFLTAGIMSLGLAAGTLKAERIEGKKLCGEMVNKYWDWWTTKAPLRCADIRKGGATSTTCDRLGGLAAAKVEELIKSAKTAS